MIFDVTGAIVKTGSINDSDQKVDVSHFTPGLYTIQIVKDNTKPIMFFKE